MDLPGDHAVLKAEIADLCAQLRKAQEELRVLQRSLNNCIGGLADRTIERDKWLQQAAEFEEEVRRLKMCEGWAKTMTEKRDTAIKQGKGLKLKLDLAMAGYKEDIVAGYRQRAEAAERDAEAQRALIDAIIRSVEQGKELWTPELRAKSGIPELQETPCPKSEDGHCDHWYDDEGPCCHCGDDVLRLDGAPTEAPMSLAEAEEIASPTYLEAQEQSGQEEGD